MNRSRALRSSRLVSLGSIIAVAAASTGACATTTSDEPDTGGIPSKDASAIDANSDGAIARPDGTTGDDGGGAETSTEAGFDAGPRPDPTKGDPYNYAPPGRTVSPVAVLTTTGNVTNPTNVLTGKATTLSGNGSYVVLDFGKEVGGLITVKFTASSDASQSVGLAFSESSLYTGTNSDNSNGSGSPDGAVMAAVAGPSTFTVPHVLLRGGFRYLTIFMNSAGSVDISQVTLDYSPDPNRAVPNKYPNYFYSNDETLNKIWYAGAYTFQTNIVRNTEGRAWPTVSTNWDNGRTVGESGNAVLTDGAKRDRTVWPGDMAVSVPTGYVALFETDAVKNSLQTLFNHEDGSGALPYAGPPMNFGGSDTYHMWTLLGTQLYYLYSGDKAFVDGVWTKYKAAVAYITGKIDGNGLLNVTATNDWARDNPGGENIQANCILYGVLIKSAFLAQIEGDSALAGTYTAQAAALKTKINGSLWDSSVGAFKDNPTSTLYPQDGNALAVWFGVVDTPSKARGLSYVLGENWNDKGSRGPEFTFGTGTPRISSFAGSMELMGHFTAGYDTRGLEMIRTMWGFMLNSPDGTKSTFWEGLDSAGHFAYQDSFTSLSHGWGTGPTSALTFYVLGIAPDTASGQTYHVMPHPGDLTHVEGNITVAAGKMVTASYDVAASCKTFSLYVDAKASTGSLGTIGIPRFGVDHTITVDGVVAWDGTKLVATAGIAGAAQSDDFISFTGVSPGAHTYAFSDGNACPPPPERWTFCAEENAQCAFTGTKRVRYGKRGKYTYGIYTGGVACTTATVGSGTDPIMNVAKSCQISDDLYTACANEGGTCTFTGTKEVRFGANGQWVAKTLSGGTPCDVATFGDPIDNTVKTCEMR